MSTLRDVAARARVSIKTASRVVNGEPGVAPDTVSRVRRAVRSLDYVPNVSARRLVRRRAHVLGLVVQNKSWNWLNDFQRGAIARARESGYELLMHPFDPADSKDLAGLLRSVDQGSVDGLILTPPCSDFPSLREALAARGTAHVLVSPTDRSGPTPSVGADDHAGARAMTEYLLGLGHRRIAFVAGGPEQRSSHDREAGYREALDAEGIAVREDWILRGDFSFESGLACGRQLMGLDSRPSAVFVSNDDMAAGLLQVCHERGVRIPEQLSVAGFDDVDLARQVWPPLTTIHQPTAAIAERATELLVDRLDRGVSGASHETLSTRLVARASTGPA